MSVDSAAESETEDRLGVGEVSLPQKKYYRQRAHSNPLSDHSFD